MKTNKLPALMFFSLGLVTGAVLMGCWFRFHWELPPQPPDPNHIIQMFAAGLNLSDEQYAGLRKIILDNDGRFRALHDEMEPKLQALMGSVKTDIRKLLNDKQRAEFDRRMAEHEARWKRHPGPPGLERGTESGPGPGPERP
jgi:hypothetical protein